MSCRCLKAIFPVRILLQSKSRRIYCFNIDANMQRSLRILLQILCKQSNPYIFCSCKWQHLHIYVRYLDRTIQIRCILHRVHNGKTVQIKTDDGISLASIISVRRRYIARLTPPWKLMDWPPRIQCNFVSVFVIPSIRYYWSTVSQQCIHTSDVSPGNVSCMYCLTCPILC